MPTLRLGKLYEYVGQKDIRSLYAEPRAFSSLMTPIEPGTLAVLLEQREMTPAGWFWIKLLVDVGVYWFRFYPELREWKEITF